MLELDYAIKDVHGNILPAAVIVINNLNYHSTENSNSSVIFNPSEGLTPISNQTNSTHHLNFSVLIWRDRQAYDEKLQPMTLKNVEGQDWFNIQLGEPILTLEDREERCKAYLIEHVISKLRTSGDN